MKVGIFIGRFQPVHNGHLSVFSYLQDRFDRVFILLGSANRRRSIKNPFTFSEREHWIRTAFTELAVKKNISFPTDRLSVVPINDYMYNDTKWEVECFYQIHALLDDEEDADITLVGYEKDASSYYLHSFPQWRFEAVEKVVNVDATDIRTCWFASALESLGDYRTLVPPYVADAMLGNDAPHFANLLAEYRYYSEEQARFASYPYPDTLKFLCADTILLCKGHVLLVQRKYAPGKDCWALPGGFVQRDETFEQAALRELFEETRVKVPARVVAGSIKARQMFDDPRRSLGIPRVTMAFLIEIAADADGRLPKVKGSDDAQDARWIPLARARAMALYDDHGDIIDFFTGSL